MAVNDVVPVVMFHSVGLEHSDWVFNHLSEPIELFEAKVRLLVERGYEFLFWDELYAHMSGTKGSRGPAVMLTFDDGYLDNWAYALPILERYGAKATIFVSPEFVDPRPIVRRTMADEPGLPPSKAMGFLSWEELRRMEMTGLVDIQSHALTHTWYFQGETLVDFFRPSSKYPWLTWNEHPEGKPFYMTANRTRVPFGSPVYQHEKALVCRRYFHSPELARIMADWAREQNLLHSGDPKDLERYRSHHQSAGEKYQLNGRYETDEECRSRVSEELAGSRRILSEQLGKEVRFLCWPNGAYNREAVELAQAAGYESFTLSSRDQTGKRNRPGADPRWVKRMSSYTRRTVRGRHIGPGDPEYFLRKLKEHQGHFQSRMLVKASQLKQLVVSWG
jgi:peptidoglycan/xylan/chitin deacetylase (PgdA/CDA1 family)